MFTHDVEAALHSTAALVNTLPALSDSGRDELDSLEKLDSFYRRHGFTGAHSQTPEGLTAVRAIREPLHALWTTTDDERVAELINGILTATSALPQLVRHDATGWHLHATSAERQFADRILVEAAMAWVDVIRTGERERMRICAAADCEAVLVDVSRNRSKRYCDVSNCGNRANVAAYRARRKPEDLQIKTLSQPK
nr:CGNR zinc finger domain-containing protein [Leifsonia psychrotolerans]